MVACKLSLSPAPPPRPFVFVLPLFVCNAGGNEDVANEAILWSAIHLPCEEFIAFQCLAMKTSKIFKTEPSRKQSGVVVCEDNLLCHFFMWNKQVLVLVVAAAARWTNANIINLIQVLTTRYTVAEATKTKKWLAQKEIKRKRHTSHDSGPHFAYPMNMCWGAPANTNPSKRKWH